MKKYYHQIYEYYCTDDCKIFNSKGREMSVRHKKTCDVIRISYKSKKFEISVNRFFYECFNHCLLTSRAHVIKLDSNLPPTKDNLRYGNEALEQKPYLDLGWYRYQVIPKKSVWQISEETPEGIVNFYPSYATITPKSKREAIRRINIVKLPYIQGSYKKSLITIKRKNN